VAATLATGSRICYCVQKIMLDAHVRLCPNREEVAAKVLDGEAILINLANGMYYSLDLAGGFAWQLIEAECTLDEIAEAVCLQYGVDAATAFADVRRLADDLLAAGLVHTSADRSGPRERPAAASERLPYEGLRLNAYHDMAELLALDPPHPGLANTLSAPLDQN
jgi:hypothetical protein